VSVIVIGAGPAGLLAAWASASAGAETIILEQKPKAALKLRITGKGRCNITNSGDMEEFLQQFPGSGKFLYGAFTRFFREDLILLLSQQQVEVTEERGGRIFPVSGRAGDVADALLRAAQDQGARLKTGTRAASLILEQDRVVGVRTGENTDLFGKVIVATGGKSYPQTGSDGSGYILARQAGHTVSPLYPSLVSLKVRETWVGSLAGLTLKNVRLTALTGDKSSPGGFGEMLFTHTGISGPIVLSLSRDLVPLLEAGQTVPVSLDLKPALDSGTLDQRLVRETEGERKELATYMKTLVPRSLIPVLLECSGLDGRKKASALTRPERNRLVQTLKDVPLHVVGHGGFAEAVVTRGGVSLRQVHPRTMESRLFPGLYFAGEVLDLDAYTGGYNLQAAFSTGYLAGISAAKEENRHG